MRRMLAIASALFACGVAAADDVDVVHARVTEPRGVPTLHVAPVRVGDPPVALIRAVVHREKWADLRACYRSGLRRNPKLGGRVDVELAVEPSGAVSAARAPSTTVHDADVVRCIVRAFAAVVFPRMRATILVRYPIELAPQSDTT